MSWPWSPGSQGPRRSQRRSFSCKPADLLAFCLTLRVCVNVFVGPDVMKAPKCLKVSGTTCSGAPAPARSGGSVWKAGEAGRLLSPRPGGK